MTERERLALEWLVNHALDGDHVGAHPLPESLRGRFHDAVVTRNMSELIDVLATRRPEVPCRWALVETHEHWNEVECHAHGPDRVHRRLVRKENPVPLD